MRPGRGLRDRQRPVAARPSATGSGAGYPDVDHVEAVARSGRMQGWDAAPGRHGAGPSTRARTSSPSYASSSPRAVAEEILPSTRAPRSTTRSTCGSRASEPSSRVSPQARRVATTRVGSQHPARSPNGLWAEHEVQDPDELDGDLLERLAHRGQPGPGDLGRERVVEADHADVAPGSQAALGARVQHAHRQGVARAGEAVTDGSSSSSCAAIRAASTLSVIRDAEAGDVLAGGAHRRPPAAAPVLADPRGLLPAQPGDPPMALLQQVLGGERARRAAPSTSTQAWSARGSSHGRPNATKGAPRSLQEAGLRASRRRCR